MSSLRVAHSVAWLLLTGLVAMPALAQDAKEKAPKRERNRISREELVQGAEKFPDLYEAIRSLRPHFLTANNRGVRTTGVGPPAAGDPASRSYGTGGSTSANPQPVVWLDGRKSGDPEVLKGILSRDVEEVRYLGPNEAGIEYGLGHEGGAIVVKRYQGEKRP